MGGLIVLFLSSFLSLICLFYVTIFAAVFFYLIVSYTFESISVMSMNQKSEAAKPFLSWIPFYNKYLLGKITGNSLLGILSGLLTLISICLGAYFYFFHELELTLFVVLVISFIGAFISDTMIAQNIYKSRAGKFHDLLTILTVLSLGLVRPLFLFILRNR